jgi:peptidyl-prolyl cis-trans isomerase D
MVDTKEMPDTVKVRHILVSTQQQGQVVREDSTAKKLMDSIQLAIKNGANFDSLCKKYSDDQGSKDKGGVIDNIYSGQMVPAFNDFVFSHPVGDKGVVKSEFGYHYIEVISQKGKDPAYKIAYLSRKIEASDETEKNAENAALQFAGASRNLKDFDNNFDKDLKPKGKQKLVAPDINSHSYSIPGVGANRKFIKEVFDADEGDVLQPERVEDNFVVAVVTQIRKPGTMSAAEARAVVEPILRNRKKADVLKKQIGNITTLDAVSASMKQPVQSVDSIRFNGGANNPVSYDPRIVGATFNPGNKGKVVNEALEGRFGGLYVIRVDNVTSTIVENADISAQKKNMESQSRMRILMSNQYSQFGGYGQQYDPAEVLRKAATIKDYRNKFY